MVFKPPPPTYIKQIKHIHMLSMPIYLWKLYGSDMHQDLVRNRMRFIGSLIPINCLSIHPCHFYIFIFQETPNTHLSNQSSRHFSYPVPVNPHDSTFTILSINVAIQPCLKPAQKWWISRHYYAHHCILWYLEYQNICPWSIWLFSANNRCIIYILHHI